jgi:Chaperone of endosialidase
MGGGAPEIPQRQPGPEWQTIKRLYGGQENQLNRFVRKDPLLSQAYPFATKQLGDVAGLQKPLETLLGQAPGQFAGYQKELAGFNRELGGLDPALAGLDPALAGLVSSQQGLYQGLQPTLQTQGRLTPEQQRDVAQATRAGFAARGNVMGNQALGSELLNRDAYRQQRFGTALQQALGLSGSIGGLQGERAGLLGQRAGITGQRAGITGQEAGLTGAEAATTAGLASGIQGLGSQALQNLLGTSRAAVQNFSDVTNPIVGYLSDLFSSNQNAAGSQAVAGANKSGGTAGGVASGVGSIISTVLPIALAAFSDERLKTDVKSTGLESPEGIPLKTFRYKDGTKNWFLGVLAQDVEKVVPGAVMRHPVTGHRLVDLSQLSVPFHQIKPVKARVTE